MEMLDKEIKNMLLIVNQYPRIRKWMIEYNPDGDGNKGFLFPRICSEEYKRLGDLTENDGHSGASFACCCRHVQKILLNDSAQPE